MVVWRGKGVVNTETVTGTMIGSTTGIAPEDGSTTGIEEDIRTRTARWRCRGTGDGGPNLQHRAQMQGSICPPRGMGIPRERHGPEAGCPRRQGAGPRRRPSSSRSSKVRAKHGRTALTVGFFVFFCTSPGTRFSKPPVGSPSNCFQVPCMKCGLTDKRSGDPTGFPGQSPSEILRI